MRRRPGNAVRRQADASASEGDLCIRLRQSDQGALREIFRRWRDDLVRYVGSIIRDDVVAHDLVQDVFISLWDLRQRLDANFALRSYIYRMARNRALRHLRDERLHAEKHEEIQRGQASRSEQSDMPDSALDGALLGRRLQLWLAELPDRQYETLVLSRFHGMSHREIAEVMGISPRTVNNHMLRALSFLQERVNTLQTPAG